MLKERDFKVPMLGLEVWVAYCMQTSFTDIITTVTQKKDKKDRCQGNSF